MTSLRFLPEQTERWPIARLVPYAKNARTHSDDQIARIAASLVEFGWTAPVMVADDGEIVAGHGLQVDRGGNEEGLDAHIVETAADGAGETVPGLRLAVKTFRAPAVLLVEALVVV